MNLWDCFSNEFKDKMVSLKSANFNSTFINTTQQIEQYLEDDEIDGEVDRL